MEAKEGSHLKTWIGQADSDKWRRFRVGIGLDAPCANFCRFCERNQALGEGLDIIDFPQSELVDKLKAITAGRKEPVEFVLTGGIVGEPLMRDVGYLANIIKTIKSVFPQSEVRLNTTGNIFNQEQSLDVIRQLKTAGLDSIAISLNACNGEDYKYLCRPSVGKGGSFKNALAFIKASLVLLGAEQTYVSFVNYNDHPDAPKDWPRFTRHQATELLKPLDVLESNIVFRDYIPLKS